jgi:hypothetical protein
VERRQVGARRKVRVATSQKDAVGATRTCRRSASLFRSLEDETENREAILALRVMGEISELRVDDPRKK